VAIHPLVTVPTQPSFLRPPCDGAHLNFLHSPSTQWLTHHLLLVNFHFLTQGGDPRFDGFEDRDDLEICQLNKVNWRGTALFRPCGNSTSDSCVLLQEQTENAFKFCSKCCITVYCSANCQRQHWPVHKKCCGDIETETELPSSAALNSVMREGIAKAAQTW
jgi:hypothetical protein